MPIAKVILGCFISLFAFPAYVTAQPTVKVISDVDPVWGGQPVTFTANVTGGVPGGNVTFTKNSTPLAINCNNGGGSSVPLTSGVATCTVVVPSGDHGLALGPNTITAAYRDNPANTIPTAIDTMPETMQIADPTVNLTPSANPTLGGQALTWNVTVTGATPPYLTGTVSILKNSLASIGCDNIPLVNGQAACILTSPGTTLGIGNIQILAKYSGDASNYVKGYLTSQNVIKNTPTVSVISSANPSAPGQTVTLTAFVDGAPIGSQYAATGTVTFSKNFITPIGCDNIALTMNYAYCNFMSPYNLNVGSYSITAKYSGDANDNPANSDAFPQVVATPVNVTVNVSGAGVVISGPLGLDCPGTCSFGFFPPVELVLAATPTSYPVRVDWNGCDSSAGLACYISSLSAPRTISATFSPITPTPFCVSEPWSPDLTDVNLGVGQATFFFTPPISDGGCPVQAYDVTCNYGLSAHGTGSPLTVVGFANSFIYLCDVTATNAMGTSASASRFVEMLVTVPPFRLLSVVSRKTHGIAGTYNLPIDLQQSISSNQLTVEPRVSVASHQIVFAFNRLITATGTATVLDYMQVPIVGIAGTLAKRNEVTVTLPSIPDTKRVTVLLNGVNGSFNTSASIGFLVGDVDNSHNVGVMDISAVKARSGQRMNTTNFKYDLNTSGAINAVDVLTVKSRLGNVLQ